MDIVVILLMGNGSFLEHVSVCVMCKCIFSINCPYSEICSQPESNTIHVIESKVIFHSLILPTVRCWSKVDVDHLVMGWRWVLAWGRGSVYFSTLQFSYFYLYKESNFGSIGNVSRDGILFVA